jgi:isoleucyl-tRNA synthetase
MEQDALPRMAGQLEEELNVREVVPIRDESDFLNYDIKPNLPVLGPKYGRDVGKIRQALSKQDPNAIAASIAAGHNVEAGGFSLEPSEVLVTTVEKEGFASAQEAGYVVVLDTEITDELRDEGLAREIVHRIQNLRKDAGFEISDRITTYIDPSTGSGSEIWRVLRAHEQYVKDETLSLAIVDGPPPPSAHSEEESVDGQRVTLGVERAG